MLDKLGSSISIGTGLDETGISVRCLKKNLQATLDILEERLLEPKFTQDAFDRLKNQQLESIKNSKTRAATVASTAFSKVLYGNQNMLGLPGGGTLESVQAIALSDIEDYYKKYITRSGLKAVVVGDISEAEAQGILARLKKLPNTPVSLPTLPNTATAVNSKTIYVIDIPKAAQTEFRVGYVTNLTYSATEEYYQSGLMNFPLGGAFNCRINLNLREDKGWTYGARAGFNGNKYTGTYTFSSGIKTPATDSALSELLREINEFTAKGVTPEEVQFMKNSIGQSDARKYETGGQKAGFLSNILDYNLPYDYVRDQTKVLDRINENDLNMLARKWLNTNNMHIVLAGDKKVIAPGLEKMGYTLVELDADGNRK
jgi:zinc protease